VATKLLDETGCLHIPTAEVFEPLLQPSRYKGAHGGRGSGKSHFFGELLVEKCIMEPGSRIVCVRELQKSLKESVKLLIEDKIERFEASGFRVLSDHIVAPGGGLILFQGMQDHTAESIKSLENFSVAYIEEAQTLTERSLELLRPTIRAEGSEIWASWNPRSATDPIDALLRGPEPPPSSIVVEANYMDNPFFPEVLHEERLYDKKTNPIRYAHIWQGAYQPMAVGAIFDMANINTYRVGKEDVPELSRVVVGVDPAGSSENGSDETGIVVGGVGIDQRGYILDEVSLVGTPEDWGNRAIAVHDFYEADAIVAETNFGGEMVAQVIHAKRPNIRVIKAHAARAKHIRAEPISALYSLGRVAHAGAFPLLEAQMCMMTNGGYEGEGSPDKVDALVWCLSELFPKITKRTDTSARPTRSNSAYSPHRWRS